MEVVMPAVAGQQHPRAVEDPAARRHQQLELDAVLVGPRRVLLVLQDLQLVQALGDDREEAAAQPQDQQGTAVEIVSVATLNGFHVGAWVPQTGTAARRRIGG